MKRCDPKARAKCPDGKQCELYAEFADGSECDKFNEKVLSQPMTNADRIRAMSDEKLEDFIRNVALHFEPWCDNHCKMDGDDDCNKCLAKWLKQPAEDSDGK